MERAARALRGTTLSKKILSDDDIARAVWPAAVGKAIAAHTMRVKLVRSTLVVEVADAIWQKQLFCLSQQILDRLRKVTASGAITDIEFRIGAPRREPQRAADRQGGSADLITPSDDADGIHDPVLKKVYQLSRKKATA